MSEDPATPPNPQVPDTQMAEALFGILQQDSQELGDEASSPTLPLGSRTSVSPSAEKPGEFIGRYRLIEEIGEGGFGVVWRAEQTEPIHREVALKVIKPGMDSREIIARFEAERQALALMDHPNIAGVLDAGATPNGRPFFVMELVKGRSITEYCDESRLSVDERLELFIPVCQAVQHAHQKAILHRDLKPSNILVAEVDGKPVPKVIDFGIAKALGVSEEAALQASLIRTQAGLVIGTPQYMSPEQAGSVPDVDTRSDIYTLGVILYELLTGDTPLGREELKKAALDEVLRLIREGEPRRPSSRFIPATDLASRTATLRHTESKKLSHALRGDLDWILLKALEKDRARRYETANAFALDLRRHLDDEPVSAGPPGAVYRLKKLVRRNKVAAVFAAVVASGFLLILFLVTLHSRQLKKERDYAHTQEVQAKAAGERAESMLTREQLQRAEKMLQANDESGGLAYLAHVLRRHPEDKITASRLLSALRDRSRPQLRTGPRHEPKGQIIRWMDGRDRLLLVQDRRLISWNLATGLDDFLLPGVKASFVQSNDDGSRLLIFTDTNHCRIYDTRTWRPATPELVRDDGGTRWASEELPFPYVGAISTDGQWVATVVNSPTVRVWDAGTGREVGKLPPVSRPTFAAFHPDSKILAVGCRDGSVEIHALNGVEWKLVQHIQAGASMVTGLRYAGTSLLVMTENDLNLISNVIDRSNAHATKIAGGVTCLALSPNNDYCLTAQTDHKVRFWDSKSGRNLENELDLGEPVFDVAFSGDGSRFLTVTAQAAQVWASTGAHPIANTRKFPVTVQSALLNQDGTEVVVTLADGSISVWHVGLSRALPVIYPMPTSQTLATLHENGAMLAVGDLPGRAAVWDLRSGLRLSPVIQTLGDEGHLHDIKFQPGTGRLWSASDRTEAVPWDWRTGKQDGNSILGDGYVYGFSFDKMGKRLVVRGNHYRIYDLATGGSIVGDWTTSGTHVREPVLSRDGHYLLADTFDGKRNYAGSMVWDLQSQKHGVPFAADAYRMLFTAGNCEQCIALYPDATARVWDASTGQPLTKGLHHQAEILGASLLMAGGVAATASEDNTARLWHVPGGEPIGVIMRHRAMVFKANLSPDGHRVATTSNDGTVRVWDVPSGRPLTEPLDVLGGIAETQCLWHPDNTRIITTGLSPAQCWDVSPVDASAPPWLAEWAEAVGGMRMDDQDELSPLPVDSERPFAIQSVATTKRDLFSRTLKWYYQPLRERRISPDGEMTRHDLLTSLCAAGVEQADLLATWIASEESLPWGSMAWHTARNHTEGTADESVRQEEMTSLALKRNPKEGTALLARARLLAIRNQTDEAIHVCQEALPLVAGNSAEIDGRVMLAELLAVKQKPDEVVRITSDLLKVVTPMYQSDAQRKHWFSLRRDALINLGNWKQLYADNALFHNIPKRRPEAQSGLVDLTAFYTHRLDENINLNAMGQNYAEVPQGVHDFAGVSFDVRGVIRLRARNKPSSGHNGVTQMPDLENPISEEGIPVNAICRRVHFLHTSESTTGIPMGAYVVHYADGQVARVVIANLVNIADHYLYKAVGATEIPSPKPPVVIAWKGNCEFTRAYGRSYVWLYRHTWENPRPNVPVTTIDFVSIGSGAGPCLFAITRE